MTVCKKLVVLSRLNMLPNLPLVLVSLVCKTNLNMDKFTANSQRIQINENLLLRMILFIIQAHVVF